MSNIIRYDLYVGFKYAYFQIFLILWMLCLKNFRHTHEQQFVELLGIIVPQSTDTQSLARDTP